MDIIFECNKCGQSLTVDAAGAGSEIECPSCATTLVVPESSTGGDHGEGEGNDEGSSPPATPPRESKSFKVPIHETAPEGLIAKPLPPLDAAAKEGDRKLKIKIFKHSECVEVGKDHFEEVVNHFLNSVGEAYITGLSTFNYTHQDLATRQWVTDYGVMITYKG